MYKPWRHKLYRHGWEGKDEKGCIRGSEPPGVQQQERQLWQQFCRQQFSAGAMR